MYVLIAGDLINVPAGAISVTIDTTSVLPSQQRLGTVSSPMPSSIKSDSNPSRNATPRTSWIMGAFSKLKDSFPTAATAPSGVASSEQPGLSQHQPLKQILTEPLAPCFQTIASPPSRKQRKAHMKPQISSPDSPQASVPRVAQASPTPARSLKTMAPTSATPPLPSKQLRPLRISHRISGNAARSIRQLTSAHQHLRAAVLPAIEPSFQSMQSGSSESSSIQWPSALSAPTTLQHSTSKMLSGHANGPRFVAVPHASHHKRAHAHGKSTPSEGTMAQLKAERSHLNKLAQVIKQRYAKHASPQQSDTETASRSSSSSDAVPSALVHYDAIARY